MTNWENTQIWQRLLKIKNDEADKVRSFLLSENCMSKIETILRKGSTSSKDFTLHDDDHSYRVADRMWQIIPTSTQRLLSEYELAFLLLSAYLHDIGMTPEYKKVNNHFKCLNTKNKDAISLFERKSFQKWLDEEGEQIDIEKDELRNDERTAGLVTLYCRYKHNDWSEEWIRTNFSNIRLGNYTNWLNDLVNICKSHHYGFDELKSDQFNPLRIHGKVIHKRYIAMCLRLADVIEIDPERAPEVLIKHRSVIDGSLSHWLKEKFTSIDIVNNCISVTANPTQAFIHKAILDVADQIEHETILCNTIKGEIPLRNISPSNDLKHEWNILPSIYRGIKESGDYEFIDGTFRPNSKKLLQLLAGTELYGNPLLAIREIIQNSFDAIKVQIAYKILEEGYLTEQQFESVRSKFLLEIIVEKSGNDYWLICKDNGVGMDKEIIKKCFLIGGASKRHELLELERKCQKIDYKIGLTGRFGIGVMSYFMLADKMIIKTKKSLQSGNLEMNGWEFEINGLSDFGELRKCECNSSGTTIKLRIKKELTSEIVDSKRLFAFINTIINKVPCNFKVVSDDKQEVSCLPGWYKGDAHFKNYLIEQFNQSLDPKVETINEFVSEERRSKLAVFNKRKLEVQKRFNECIDFIVYEGVLKNQNGYYRIHIPVFKNKKGESFCFFFETKKGKQIYLQNINEGYFYFPNSHQVNVSWKGIKINGAFKYNRKLFVNCFIELDLMNEDSFDISVSRLSITYKDKTELIVEEAIDRIQEVIYSNRKRFSGSVYQLFNHLVAKCLPLDKDYMYWAHKNGDDQLKFERVQFPLNFCISYNLSSKDKDLFLDAPLYQLNSIESCGGGYPSFVLRQGNDEFSFDKAVFHNYHDFRISFLYLNFFERKNKFRYIGNSSNFPPEWNSLFCFRGYNENEIVLNENSHFIKWINEQDYEFVKTFFKERMPLDGIEGRMIIQDRSKAFCFMLFLISVNKKSYWDGITRNNKPFINELWNKMFGNQIERIFFFHDAISPTSLIAISIDNWQIISADKEIEKYLPIPGAEWRIDTKKHKIITS